MRTEEITPGGQPHHGEFQHRNLTHPSRQSREQFLASLPRERFAYAGDVAAALSALDHQLVPASVRSHEQDAPRCVHSRSDTFELVRSNVSERQFYGATFHTLSPHCKHFLCALPGWIHDAKYRSYFQLLRLVRLVDFELG